MITTKSPRKRGGTRAARGRPTAPSRRPRPQRRPPRPSRSSPRPRPNGCRSRWRTPGRGRSRISARRAGPPPASPATPVEYWVDACQRTVLFWDVLRKRGNQAIEHYKAGKPPVLVFEYEMVVDGRQLERPVNYALVRIKPEAGETARSEEAAVRDGRPARRPRSRHRRLQGGERGRRRAARRPPGLLRDLLSGARARPDARGHRPRRDRLRPEGRRAAPRC